MLTIGGVLCLVACGPGPVCWETALSGQDPILLTAWASPTGETWVAGGGGSAGRAVVLRDRGAGFEAVPLPVTTDAEGVIWWTHATPRGDLYWSGERGLVLHWHEGLVERVTTDDAEATLYGIWGAGEDTLYAVGGVPGVRAVLMRGSATGLRTVADAPQPGGTWFKAWGSGPSDVYFVGQRGALYHFDGARYDRLSLAGTGVLPEDPLFTITGTGPNDVYAVGGLAAPRVIHFDGRAFTALAGVPLDGVAPLTGVSALPSGELALSGLSGTRLLFRHGRWQDDSHDRIGFGVGMNDGSAADLHAVFLRNPDEAIAVGGRFFEQAGGVVLRTSTEACGR